MGKASGSGSLAGAGGAINWAPKTAIAMPAASLWHVVSPPNKPALYTATAELTVAGKVVDSVTETFGVRKTNWTGMWTHHALSNQLDCTLEGIGGAHTPLPQGVREPGHPADGTTSEEHLCHFADFMLTCVSCAHAFV